MHRQAGDPVDIVITTDSTATAGDVARHIAASDPTRSIPVAEGDVLTLAVAPPTGDRLVPLQPDVPIGEAPIGSGFAASIVNYGPDYAVAGQREIVGVLVATSGALAGQEFPIAAGHVFLGREAGNDVVLTDPMVSKRHARLEVGTHIEVVDLNSANGVLVDGVAVQRVRVEEGEPFVIGGTTLVLRLARSFDGSATEEPIMERGGGLLFNRSPRVEVRYPGTLFKIPRLPTEKIGRMFPWPILIAPILAGMALYALNGNPRSLLIIVMTPLMAFGNIINQAAQSKKGENHEIVLFERQYEQLEEDFFHGKPEEERARNAEAPPVAEIFDHAMRLGPMLWTRRPEHWNFLGLRLGSCRLPARNSIDDAETPTASRTSSTVWTGSAIATRSSTTSRCSRPSWMPGRSASPGHKVRSPTRCAASLCSCSACTPRTTSSSWPSRIPPGRRSWTGSSGCRTPPATRARSATWRSRIPRRPAPRC